MARYRPDLAGDAPLVEYQETQRMPRVERTDEERIQDYLDPHHDHREEMRSARLDAD